MRRHVVENAAYAGGARFPPSTVLRSCFMVVLSQMIGPSYITRYAVFQTLKAATAARLICAAMVAVVGSAS